MLLMTINYCCFSVFALTYGDFRLNENQSLGVLNCLVGIRHNFVIRFVQNNERIGNLHKVGHIHPGVRILDMPVIMM